MNDMSPRKPMAATLRRPRDLADAGLVAESAIPALEEVAVRYAVAVTPAVAALIDRDDPGDPIARQFVPDIRELATTADELADPIGDGAHEVTPGLIHRYPDRVLLKFVSTCAVYCRFCFRRETVGQGEGMSPGHWPLRLIISAPTPPSSRSWCPVAIRWWRRRGALRLSSRRWPQSRTSSWCGSTPACPWWRPSASRPSWSRR